ncbi:MAG: nucleotidyltransferase domain-containing protein [Nitrososphaeria archaeon]|nr:nucleotidyltransferase domain-containing protein [Nitrososphaeria archaeon]
MSIHNYIEIVKRVKAIVQSIEPNAKVYLFGSTAKGKATAASDIDILIVTNLIEHKYDIMVKVYRTLEEPIELHMTTPEMLKNWYKRFITEEELIEA